MAAVFVGLALLFASATVVVVVLYLWIFQHTAFHSQLHTFTPIARRFLISNKISHKHKEPRKLVLIAPCECDSRYLPGLPIQDDARETMSIMEKLRLLATLEERLAKLKAAHEPVVALPTTATVPALPGLPP